jgi:hypothetical protein
LHTTVVAIATKLLYVEDFWEKPQHEEISSLKKYGQLVEFMIHHQFLIKVVTGRQESAIGATFFPRPGRQ